MDVVLRAYDHEAVLRAEALPVERLHVLLAGAGMRDAQKARAGLGAPADLWARETIAERLASLIQEGYGQENLARLRGSAPPDLATLRRPHWPPIGREEAIALREDLVRYLTYGIWQAPEPAVARALAMLTGQPDVRFLLGDPAATAGLQEVLDLVEDDERFALRFGPAVERALAPHGGQHDAPSVRRELGTLQQLLGPVARLLHQAPEVGLRVIAYQDQQGGDGLARFLAEDMERAGQIGRDDTAP